MLSVGVREFKAHISKYLQIVSAGDTVVIKNRNDEIAYLLPKQKNGVNEKLIGMIQEGVITWSGGKPAGLVRRVPSRGKPASAMVNEDRR